MATFRKVHVQFWSDPFIQELTPEQKFFYLFLLTNDKTKQCGIYEITKRQICYDTGYNIDTVSKLLGYFIEIDKIKYNPQTNEVSIKNWNKYNGSTSPTVQQCINQELKNVKDTVLIEYIYGMDNVEILTRNKNKNKKENKIQEEERNFSTVLIESGTQMSTTAWRKECTKFLKDEEWKHRFCQAKNIIPEKLEKSMNEFVLNLNLKEDFKNVAGLKKHYTNHYNKHGLVVSQIDKPKEETRIILK